MKTLFAKKKQKKFQISLDICLLIGYTIADSGGTVPLQKPPFEKENAMFTFLLAQQSAAKLTSRKCKR
ncbi:MAG: hypothetical protein LBT46_02215, partial [Planctomycetaceae bacterium]|nr:hypothetical protein [Planctomycetaceae bacterium]